jgi:Di-haem oxidoreductase, putative peroxidase
MQYDGTVVRRWRTTPLWGVASTAPYGHDGASLTLDDAIRRHGGEARPARDAYDAMPRRAQRELLAFLETLTLYQTDQVPCDVNGDGAIEEHFLVAGQDTGLERLNPEWLFRRPGRIEGPVVNPRGETLVSFALMNIREAYELDQPLLRDADGDTFPDVIDAAPQHAGFRDGVE